MNYALYDYLDEHGVNLIKEWAMGLQKRERVRLNQKLDMLQHMECSLLINCFQTPALLGLRNCE